MTHADAYSLGDWLAVHGEPSTPEAMLEMVKGASRKVPVYPGLAANDFAGERILPMHIRDVRPDMFWTAGDVWPFAETARMAARGMFVWGVWAFVDFDWVDPTGLLDHLSAAAAVVPTSVWLERKLRAMPSIRVTEPIHLGVNTEAFTPLRGVKDDVGEEITGGRLKQGMSMPEDCFMVGMVQMNQLDRKPFEEQLEGVKRFRDLNPDVKLRLYIHTFSHSAQGWDMVALVREIGLGDVTSLSDDYKWLKGIMGYGDMTMCKIYNAMDVLLQATGGECMAPDTSVTTNFGSTPISALKVGDTVLGGNGWTRVKNVYSKDYRGEIVQVKIRGIAQSLRFTPEHPVLAFKRTMRNIGHRFPASHYLEKRPDWVLACELEKHDLVVLPREKGNSSEHSEVLVADYVEAAKGRNQFGAVFPHSTSPVLPESLPINEDLLFLAGMYVSEGWGDKSGLCFANTSTDIVDHIKEAGQRLFKIEPRVRLRRTSKSKHDCAEVAFQSSTLVALFHSLFGKGARHKRLPEFFLNLSDEKIALLIQSLMLGDGYIDTKRVAKAVYSTTSPILCDQIVLLSRRIGLFATVARKRGGEHRITLSGSEAASALGFPRFSKREWSAYAFGNGQVLVPVSDVSRRNYEGKVFDIEVEDGSHAFAAPFLVHNSPGMPVLEAQACGTPVIGTDFGALPEHIAAGELVKVGSINRPPERPNMMKAVPSPDSIASQLETVYNRGRDYYSGRARQFALENTWDICLRGWLRVLEEVARDVQDRTLLPPVPSGSLNALTTPLSR